MIENTRDRDNMVHLMGILSDGQSGYIEGMESAGQRQLVQSSVLPTEILDYDSDKPWSKFESLGFVRGEQVPGDPLFTSVTLPEGWTKEGSDHAMWSYILDDRGLRRVSVFYKAAFYDRSAHMGLMDPAADLASSAIYDESGAGATLPAQWPALTADEKASFADSVEDYIARAANHPDIYGDRLPRAMRLRELLAEGDAA
ncbi:hypothetical protein CH305_18170 [Rhodococcus sp. 15-649-2-2]|uniref:hypothetical protein n=1 Tax=Rhodococcus sp. 15-649-2-2 TaxID=2023140 RepID=UPI000B9B6D2E|nr:hypothetical protein [Rhodococcus sp. 15-649-2-2]OZE77164.1 hypothetical protein CH305_18170 [Rhodococcus sp. 15-649-2-2]